MFIEQFLMTLPVGACLLCATLLMNLVLSRTCDKPPVTHYFVFCSNLPTSSTVEYHLSPPTCSSYTRWILL